jgi:hypothetical protein
MLILWLLSPIALIIICVHLSNARAKLTEEVERLRAELRARDGTVPEGTGTYAETFPENASGETVQESAPAAMASNDAVGRADTTPLFDASTETVVPPSVPKAEETTRTEDTTAVQKKTVNPLNAVFIIGALFIVTAGIIFASSAWQDLGTVPRIATLASVSVLFFAASILARKRFDLRSTGAVFFTLGSVFLPVAFVASGLLGLFGESLTASGDRAFLLYSGGAFLLGVTALRGSLLYRSRVFAWVCLTSLTCLVAFLASSLNRGIPTVSLALALFSAVPVIALEAYARFGKRIAEVAPLEEAIRRFKASPFAEAFRPYAALSVLSAAAVTLVGKGGDYAYGATFAILAILFLSRVFNDPRYRHSGIGVFPFALCLAFWIMRLPGTEEVPSVVLASALVMTIGLLGVMPERMRKASTVASFLAVSWSAVSAAAYGAEWSAQLLGAIAILSVIVALRARSGDRAFKALHPILLVILVDGAIDLFGHSSGIAYMIAGVCLVAALVAYEPLRLRTRFSDAVFLLALLLDFFINRDHGNSSYELAIFACNLAGVLWVARKVPYARYAFPHYALLGFLATEGRLYPVHDGVLPWYALLAALGIAERFLRKRLRVPEASVSFKVAVSLWGAVGVIAGFWVRDLSAYHAMPWIACAFWLVSYFSSDEKKIADLWVAGLLALAGSLVSAMAWADARALAREWSIFAPALVSLLLLVPDRVPLIARDPARRKVLFALSVGALQVTALIASIVFVSEPWLPLSFCAMALALTAVAFAASHTTGFSALSLFPLIIVYAYADRVSPYLLPKIAAFSAIGDANILENLLYCAFFAVCAAGSMILYRALSVRREDGRVSVDCFALLAPIGPLALVSSGMDGSIANAEYWTFAGLALLAVAALLFWQRTDNQSVDRAALSASIACLTAALIVEPFFTIPKIVRDEWRLLLPLAALVFARRFVWRGRERVLGWITFAWGCACIAILSWQAIEGGHGADAIILGVGSLAIFVFSFVLKLKRIFVLSTITLAALGIYLSREFWLNLAWWIYLLSAGVALISFAIANETMRKRGSGIATKAGSLFAEWRW